MNRLYLAAILPSLILLAGCAEKVVESNSEYAARLREKAVIIGQNDLARFNATDLVYKNIPELHTTIVPIINREQHIWIKTYRHYTGFKLIDVVRSPSLLAPISYAISFRYDQFSTPFRATDTANDALALSKKDMVFELRFSDNFTRYYLCDKEGNLIDNPTPLPSRPDYFQDSYNGEANLGKALR